MGTLPVELKIVDFQISRELIHDIRKQVFIDEQNIPPELQFDEMDSVSHHVLAIIDKQAVGTGRITPDGKIGRMAVLKNFRRNGIGQTILNRLIEIGKNFKVDGIHLSSQCHAIPFYQKSGFVAQGSIYQEAGIVHQRMVLAEFSLFNS